MKVKELSRRQNIVKHAGIYFNCTEQDSQEGKGLGSRRPWPCSRTPVDSAFFCLASSPEEETERQVEPKKPCGNGGEGWGAL